MNAEVQKEIPVPRAIAAANLAALATLTPIVLYQLRLLDHLPDPPSSFFASEEITMSKAAHPFGIPDGLLGMGSFGATLVLAMGAGRYPSLRKWLALKIAADSGVASFNLVRQVTSFRKLCSWCTGTALCAFVAGAAGLPLMRAESRKLADKT